MTEENYDLPIYVLVVLLIVSVFVKIMLKFNYCFFKVTSI